MVSLLRVIKFSFQDIGRNLGMSFMTVFILVLMLLSINTLWSVDVLTSEAVKLVKDQVNVSIYFNAVASDKDVTEIKTYLGSFPEVIDVNLQTREQVLASFQERHKLSPEVLQALQELGSNPFGPTVVVKTREPKDYKKIIEAISVPEYKDLIEAKSFDEHQDAIDNIQNITNRIEKMGMGLAVLFAIISFLIIFNTIRVAIQTHRMEISIKRLVGASSWFIRGPYLIESLVFTFTSMIVLVIVLFVSLRFVDPYLSVVFPNGFSLTNYYNSHILYVFGLQTLAVLVLTVVSSALAMRKQLKV
ncbi:MAG: Cell division protein [Candidatus Magasanikbacteria bacterium GW2011_GWA2_37_8]|uniref:Cell division protein FtsX n=1 Tax=Candidatus Magasanikbacteria bacterium GW2011_GWA2_37_8 TaxID=1619036 RepID=A0A0G0H8V9_9BACT|nr:MAG: Cell division protein [Candidatus Magasanikbacteria bacterium GW2011_GWA2_37_8]